MPAKQKTILQRYDYDALDRLAGYQSSAQPWVARFYQENRVVTEIEGQVQRSIFQAHDQLLAQQRSHNAASDVTLLAMDQQRSVLHALEETQSHSVTYTPYGHHSAGKLYSLLGFNGEQPDSLTGHYVLGNGYRAFNPVLMRFNSPDSWSPFGDGGWNAYAYCAGDPVNRSDPSGHAFLLKALMMFRESKMTPMGDFQRFTGAPHVLEKIAGYLSGVDLSNFSKASTATRSIAQNIADPLGDLTPLKGKPLEAIAKFLPGDDLVSFSLASKEMQKTAKAIQQPINPESPISRIQMIDLRRTALGKKPGYFPSQVLQSDQLLSRSKRPYIPAQNSEWNVRSYIAALDSRKIKYEKSIERRDRIRLGQ